MRRGRPRDPRPASRRRWRWTACWPTAPTCSAGTSGTRPEGSTSMALHARGEEPAASEDLDVNPMYVRAAGHEVPRYRMPEGEMLPATALQVVRDELILDGNARLNLATFVTTWMEPEAEQLMTECFSKNMIDKDEYPQTAELERRCVSMLAELWHADGTPTGCSTTGASEACMLGGMARLGPRAPARLHLTGPEAAARCDENTIGVVAILGSTMDGSYEPVAEISAALDAHQEQTGQDIPVHVDAASGGFVAPFLQPDLAWDFRIPRVASINTSGHKYGLVYPGVGWIIWREEEYLPEDLIFRVNYLGGEMPTFALNFSRPGAQVAAQYYNFLRLGYSGYKNVQQTAQDIAMYLSGEISKLGQFELLSDGSDLPVFAFKLRDDVDTYSVFDISERLRMRGWQVPAYTFPENLTDMAVMRIVIRNGFSMDLANLLLDDFRMHLSIR